MKPLLQYYYRGKSFPYQLIHSIFSSRFREREFCYYTIEDDKENWKRAISFNTALDLKNCFTENIPYSVYNGAIYEKPVATYESMKDAITKETDLVFDIDIDDYDELRTCGC
jgi:DNA primase small subunit